MGEITISPFNISLSENDKKIYIDSKISINCSVKIYELSSNFIIYSNSFDLIPGVNYWIQIGPTFEILKGLKISIEHNKNIIYEELFQLNKEIDYSFISNVKYSNNENNCWAPFWEIFIKKVYEYKDIKVKKGDIVVDLGSNIGLFSIYSIFNGASKVYSVEALPTTYNYLFNNVKNYNIDTLNVAISDGITKDFFISDRSGSSSIYNKTEKKVTVNCLDFNNFIENYNINHINFLKIDIEGSEYDMFENINENYLRNNIDIIFLEFHIINNYNIDNIINKLINNNYECIITDRNEVVGMMVAKNKNNKK